MHLTVPSAAKYMELSYGFWYYAYEVKNTYYNVLYVLV